MIRFSGRMSLKTKAYFAPKCILTEAEVEKSARVFAYRDLK